MAMPRESNYDLMSRRVRQTFLTYDQSRMIEKFGLIHDASYLYVPFCGRNYRINRKSGAVEGSDDGFSTLLSAGYNEVMAIYDALSRTDGAVHLTGRFALAKSLPGTGYTAPASADFFTPHAKAFSHRTEELSRACAALGGVREGHGDVAYRLAVFSFLPVLFQFYDADDEFPAQVQLLWDENTLDIVFFETTFFIASHLLSRLAEEMECLSRGMEERHAEKKRSIHR